MPPATATTLTNLFAVFGDIDALDLESASRVDLLRAFGGKIIERTGFRAVEFAITDDPNSGEGPEPSTAVTVIGLPAGTVRVAQRDESWWKELLDRPMASDDCRGVVTTESEGDGEVALIVPLRFRSCYGAVRVTAPNSLLPEGDQLAVGLFALTETLSTRRQVAQRQQRQRFYRALVDVASDDPNATPSLICRLWDDLGRADWVWLWQYNEYTERFELAAYQGQPPPPTFEPGPFSAAAYTVETDQVVMIRGDLQAWQKQHLGKTYKLVYAKEVHDQGGCQAVVCVPLVLHQPESDKAEAATPRPRVKGAICLHYCELHATPQQPKDSLVLMGRLCAQAIWNAQLEEQRRIFVLLTQLAQRHLTRVSRRPAQVRTEYLTELIDLIRTSLHFRTTSIFYRRPFDEAIECIATTGLATPKGEPISAARLSMVVYHPGEGRTGKCFQSGDTLIVNPKAKHDDHTPLSRDIDPDTGDRVRGYVFLPIKRQDSGVNSPPVIGVIRCGGYRAPTTATADGRITFQPVHVKTLEFIAQQVGPMLQILENNIRRERTISTVKHDLFTPLNMIRDTSERIAWDLEHGRTVRDYDIKNLGVSHVLATNLVAQLDAEPGFKEAYDPQPTYLVGDILARVVNMLRHFAWSFRRMNIEYDADDIIDSIPQLKIDRILIERVIHNLIVNAIKYGAPDTSVRISARSTFDGGLSRTVTGHSRSAAQDADRSFRDGYFLDIENYGLGIEDEDADLIGQPSFRSEKAKGVAQGIGLGLYIARRAMSAHKGQLVLLRRRNPTIFSMFFPRHLAT